MPKSAATPNAFIARISLVGRNEGSVKSLAGFKKQHHTVPDAVNAATAGFLAKLCAAELAAEAERYYQQARAAFAYRRTELSLEVSSPLAVLTAKDFTLELAYALQPPAPANYSLTRTLHSLGTAAGGIRPELNGLFAGQFTGIVFDLVKGLRVEAVIDAIEGRGGDDGLAVNYPSDCSHCVIAVAGVDADVMCDGSSLEMRFPRPGSPAELIAAFGAVRSAFSLSKDRVLAGLL
ncbi:MAG TPA: hypothetical protein VG734_27075 [Lacunisphaera sp.]|nr:hypothetical protein [Lacunisphaera sp.]